jgi:hypothetical protein
LPVPGRQQEAWRFTDLGLLAGLAWGQAPAESNAPSSQSISPGDSGSLRIGLDGQGDPLAGVALPAGLTALTEAEVIQALGHTLAATACEQHWPVELNHACASQLLALRVSSRAQLSLELVTDGARGWCPCGCC